MPRRDLHVLLALAVLAIAIALAQHATGLGPDVLIAAPGLLLLLPLTAGRYVGEDGLVRLARAVPRRARSGRSAPAVRRGGPVAPPRGGLLIAVALGRRGPPGLLSPR